jgi:curli biogenesis system outer membrane secretion channel CsgG
MTPRRCVFLLLLACFSACVSASAQEASLTKKQVPKAVLDAFAKAYPKATTKGFSRETEKGKTSFEVESVEGAVHRDVSYSADGSLLSIEESIAYADLPEAVRAALAKEAPKGTASSCEKITKGDVTEYEIVVRSGRKKEELLFSARGALLERE